MLLLQPLLLLILVTNYSLCFPLFTTTAFGHCTGLLGMDHAIAGGLLLNRASGKVLFHRDTDLSALPSRGTASTPTAVYVCSTRSQGRYSTTTVVNTRCKHVVGRRFSKINTRIRLTASVFTLIAPRERTHVATSTLPFLQV